MREQPPDSPEWWGLQAVFAIRATPFRHTRPSREISPLTKSVNQSRPHTRVYLTGFMGSGKSKLGPLLAKSLGWEFQDLDTLIEADSGLSVSQVFSRFGEAHFRTLERRVLEAVTGQAKPVVVALGGGAYLSEENREMLRSSGTTVWLDVPARILSTRLARKSHRPLLLGADGMMLQGEALRARVSELLEARRPAYAQADLHFVWTADKRPRELVASLLSQLRGHGL